MPRNVSRRRLLTSAGLVLAGATVAGAGAADRVQPSDRAQPDERWSRTYGRAQRNQTRTFVETGDGTIVAAGTTRGEDGREPWLFAVDRLSGRGQWARTVPNEELSANEQPSPSDVDATGDGVVVIGSSFVSGQVELLRVAPGGEVVWRRLYSAASGEASALGTSVESVGSGFLLGSYEFSSTGSTPSATAVARKVDGEGDQQWRHTFFPDQLSLLVSTETRAEGEYVGLVWLQEKPPEGSDEQPPVRSALVKFDDSGSVNWKREYRAGSSGGNQNNQLTGFVPTGDGYLLAGQTRTDSTQDSRTRGWIVTTDAEGAVQSETTLEPAPFTVVRNVGGGDGRYYVAGSVSESAQSRESRGLIARVKTDGTVDWSVTPGVKTTNRFQDVLATGDGGVAVAGVTGLTRDQAQNAEGPVTEAWLAKLGGEPAPATPTPAESGDSATPTPEPTPTPTPTPEPTPTPTPTPEETTTSGGGPGFTVGGAVAGLCGLGLLRRRLGGPDDPADGE